MVYAHGNGHAGASLARTRTRSRHSNVEFNLVKRWALEYSDLQSVVETVL